MFWFSAFDRQKRRWTMTLLCVIGWIAIIGGLLFDRSIFGTPQFWIILVPGLILGHWGRRHYRP